MSNRPWMFDTSIKCPFCGEHEMKYSNMNCPKYRRGLNEKNFIILKFTELDNKIKELENNVLELRSETRGTKVEGR